MPSAGVGAINAGNDKKIKTSTSVSVKTGNHGADEQHSHGYELVQHHVITEADDSSIVHLFQYWMKTGTFVGTGQKSASVNRSRSVTDGAKWGLAWVSGEVGDVFRMDSATGVVAPDNQDLVNNGIPQEVGAVSGLIPLQPIAPDSSSRAAIEQELADALAADSDASTVESTRLVKMRSLCLTGQAPYLQSPSLSRYPQHLRSLNRAWNTNYDMGINEN